MSESPGWLRAYELALLDSAPSNRAHGVLHDAYLLMASARTLPTSFEGLTSEPPEKGRGLGLLTWFGYGEESSLRSRSTSCLAGIRGVIKKHSLESEGVGSLLEALGRRVDYACLIIENYASTQRSESLRLNKHSWDIVEVLEEAVALFEIDAAAKGITFRLELGYRPRVPLDRPLVFRMFANLVSNAVKYSYDDSGSSHGHYIRVLSRRHGDRGAYIEITSFGVGLTQEEIDAQSVMEPGARGLFASEKGRSGLGLGLSESRRIAHAHGGSIELTGMPADPGKPAPTVARILFPGE